jgi:glutaredoxin
VSPRSRRPPEVVVYTRVGCGLCRRAEDLVAREAGRAEVRHVDVDGDERLVTRYGVRVPVVEVDGVEVAELEVAPGTVRRAVRAARRAGRRGGVGRSGTGT